jgi:ribonuclease BN (tRNA processing enzyme)
MQLITVGTACGFPKKNRFNSCEFLLVNDALYVIDAGAPVADLIARYSLSYKNLRAVFITHPHGDHIGNLPAFVDLLNGYYKFGEVQFLLPNQTCETYAKFITQTLHGERLDERLSFTVYGSGVIYQDENVTFTAISNQHCKNSYSLLVEAEGKRVLLSGDLSKDYHDLPACATDGSVDFILLECAHQSCTAVKETLPRLRANAVKINHLGRLTPEGILSELLDELCSSLACPISLAADGETNEI